MRTKLGVLGASALLALAACSGGDTADSDNSTMNDQDKNGEAAPAETASITLGVLPIVPSAALQLGINEGFFEDEGLDVTLEIGQGGAALLPGVISGETDFALSNPLSLMVADSQGLDIEVLTGYSHSLAEGDDINGTYAAADSGIETVPDLEGATVAVNTLGGQGDLTIREVLRQAGGDPDSLDFVEIGFPDMPAALETGDVEAAWLPEPFITLSEDSVNLVTYQNQEVAPGLATMVLFTGGDYSEENSDVVDRFVTAADASTAFAQDNPEKVREVLTTFLDMEEELAQEVRIEDFDADIDRDSMQALADMAEADDLVEDVVDLDSFLP